MIACSNVANLILARSVRREGELADPRRARRQLGRPAPDAAGRKPAAVRRRRDRSACMIARPMVAVLARYASRFSVRALDLTVDASLLWVGVGLALVAAVLLAFVPRLPSAEASNGLGLSNGSVRITSGTNRRLRLFAVTQIAASFVLLAGAGMLLTTLFALQRARTGMNTRNVLALTRARQLRAAARSRHCRSTRKRSGASASCPASSTVAVGTLVPWREAGAWFEAQFTVEGYAKADGEDDPRARVPHRVARFLRRPRRADHRRPGLQRRRSHGQRKGRHRQREPGAAACSPTRMR